MKEKIKKLINITNRNKIIKFISFLITLLTIAIITYIFVAVYSFTFEKDKIAIDKYNFEQREKVKTIIENDKYYNIMFGSVKTFNRVYNSDIKPIKNCYYLSHSNGKEKFIFGFKLESLINKFIHFGENYAYPSYDLKEMGPVCVMYSCEYYVVRNNFINTISNPCED